MNTVTVQISRLSANRIVSNVELNQIVFCFVKSPITSCLVARQLGVVGVLNVAGSVVIALKGVLL